MTLSDHDLKTEETDLLPELTSYPDQGCEFSKACLDCPLPVCVFDQPRGRQRWLKRQRDKEIVSLFQGGQDERELADRFRLSIRTIQRVLKKSLAGVNINRKTEVLENSNGTDF
ncbi:hypothetical protein [Dehalococcoides mccartyi]|uniref:hypothetical protein n=1 Tax=Dehalococcoides mccartyi TaxID=61435 RepID=UPI002FCC8CE8